MILPIYLVKKFFNALIICGGVGYSIFFIFSLIGYLNEKYAFMLILHLSALNSIQIFTIIPSHLFILSFYLLIINLKSKNELIVIKEYIKLRNLFFIIIPILTLFIFIEIKKDIFSTNIEKIKLNLINSKNLEDTKILISSDVDKKKFTIFGKYNDNDAIIDKYLSFETLNQTIYRGEISTNLQLYEDDLFSIDSIIYENDNFRYGNSNKKLFENFVSYWSNNNTINKDKETDINSNFNIIQSILFNILFYLCISMIFLSKKLVDRGVNNKKIFLIILLIFLYYLLIPKIMLNNFQFLFQFISIIIFVLTFFKIKQYE